MNSDMFDIGTTTENALRCLKRTATAKKAIKMAIKHNKDSLSNGSLMKIQPMIIYLSKITDRDLFCKAIKADVKMTHPNIMA
jgi:ADP-ribosylglycohydrolase